MCSVSILLRLEFLFCNNNLSQTQLSDQPPCQHTKYQCSRSTILPIGVYFLQHSNQMCVTLHMCEDKFHLCFACLFFICFCRMRQTRLTGCLCPRAAGGCGWWWTPGPVWPGSRPCRHPRWDVWRSRGPGRSSGCLRPAVPTWAPLSLPELRTSWWRCSPLGLKPKKKK